MQYTIGQITEIVNGKGMLQVPDERITRLLTDSRSLGIPEGTLFFAIETKHGDGHRFISSLYRRGVRNFVVSSPGAVQELPNANFVVVENSIAALQALAAHHRNTMDIPVVGVTGSNGKTVVKEWLYHIVEGNYNVARSPRSYNSQIGVPLSVWQLRRENNLGIFEAGISQVGEMESLQRIIRPTIGIMTNIGDAHQENFATLEEKCREKMSLFKDCSAVIYNADNALIAGVAAIMLKHGQVFAWSMKDPACPLYISGIEKKENGTAINYRYGGVESCCCIPFQDNASIEDSICCLAAALLLGVPASVIAGRMTQLEPIAMRLEVKEGKRGCMIINDSYNSDTVSLDIALDFMERRSVTMPGLGRTLILADIKQSGESPATLYRAILGCIVKRGIGKLIGVGSEISSQAALFEQSGIECHFFESTGELLASDIIRKIENEYILIKGARSFHFEDVTEALEKKVHQTILEVNLSALRDNLNRYRNALRPGTMTTCMVKANAYGAGAMEIGRTLQECGVDYLAVAVADEGAELRKQGITTGIIVMNPEPNSYRTLFDNKLEPEVYSFGMLRLLMNAAGREGITDYPVHIKIDTGMHRLGFEPHEIPRLVSMLKEQNLLVPRSVFSHFAGSDSPQFDDFSKIQVERFNSAANMLQAGFAHRILRHICNSAGAERFTDEQFDMVRLGIGLYGISPIADDATLHPISTLKTIILQIHDVPADETVGYSRKGTLMRNSRIAALPIGYADGLNRKLGNGRGYCIVNGRKAPYVGNICMDVCMIDVTGIECREGDTVEIFGPSLPATQIAQWLDTIPYEVLTSVSDRIKRVYYSD